MKLIKFISLCAPFVLLTSCAKHITYNPNDFVNPNRTVVKNVSTTPQKVDATFAMGNDPAVEKAYEQFTQKGVAQNINSKGFKTFSYDPRQRPIVTCEPLHLCVVQLEQGEIINNIDLGDSADWLVNVALVGTKANGSYQVAVKPKVFDIATDMVITTNKRTYDIGLLSQKGSATHIVNFYYPEETLDQANNQLGSQNSEIVDQSNATSSTNIDLKNLNFNYVLRGNDLSDIAWKPTRVFDDGDKTFIQMPPVSERFDLPVLYILKNNQTKQMSLVNYRYKRPYYVIDGLFTKAFLISGKGSTQKRIEIDNKNFA